jgi:hypothetical protein
LGWAENVWFQKTKISIFKHFSRLCRKIHTFPASLKNALSGQKKNKKNLAITTLLKNGLYIFYIFATTATKE